LLPAIDDGGENERRETKMADPVLNWGITATFLSACAAAGGLGLNALAQWKAQVWKRKEYVASLIKDIKDGQLSASVLLMLDWSGRKISLPVGEGNAPRTVTVTDEIVVASLIPHDYANRPKFGKTGAAIRDAFDRFFDRLTELEVMIKENLIRFGDVKPYLEYYILIIGDISHRDSSRRTLIRNIRIFIEHYNYYHVQDFIKRFAIKDNIVPTDAQIEELKEECRNAMHRCPNGEDHLD
jgi:hypothetical protein